MIGGMFGWENFALQTGQKISFLSEKHLYLANARSAIWLVIQMLKPKTVWLPSYFCDIVLQAVDLNRIKLEFFEVNSQLQTKSLTWVERVNKGDLILLIDYFGFPCDETLKLMIKERQAWILEDASQALFSSCIGKNADFIVYSSRKHLAVPDGGILVFMNNDIDRSEPFAFEPAPSAWWLDSLKAYLQKGEFDRNGNPRTWFDLFQKVDREGPIGPYKMSEMTYRLLWNGFDFKEIIQRRINNYQFLVQNLADYALFPKLLPGVIPLGFPIVVKKRNEIRQCLFDHQIYPPVHWPIKDVVPERFKESHQLAEEILTLICDQRYNLDDMAYMIQILRSSGL